jgi:deoxyribose-phosphate aldolase
MNGVSHLTEIAGLIDHTILKADATRQDVLKVCAEAREHRFASVCVNSYWVPLVARQLEGTVVKVCVVVGFPLGATSTESKVYEAVSAIRHGAQEVDMVLNVGELRAGDFEAVQADIAAVAQACHQQGAILKVILETALLNDAQKVKSCELAQAAKADFVKTSTGFSTAGATVHDVELLRRTVGPVMGVKASGGIRTFEDFQRMVAAGASRVGASASVKIVEASRDAPNA